jgi:hypothetical protein
MEAIDEQQGLNLDSTDCCFSATGVPEEQHSKEPRGSLFDSHRCNRRVILDLTWKRHHCDTICRVSHMRDVERGYEEQHGE